ncbi:MAG: ABC-2 type transport system ATP-binding protein [Candidatus Azotimanducaceae bacterium]|jgi:ABC-2 type transport system ATP-binding protein
MNGGKLMNNIIEIKNLNRCYKKGWLKTQKVDVLNNLDLNIKAGTITGLLGKNGSGKTTLMNCALGLLKPNSGSSLTFGTQSWSAPTEVRQKIGFVSQTYTSYQWMNISQLTEYWSLYYENWDAAFANRLIKLFDLPLDQNIGQLSEGQKQKASIILGISHRPELLVLDEPVSSLDPIARRTFIEVLLDYYMDGTKTVLFSTHITSDLERIATDIALLKEGSIALHTSLDNLKQDVVRIRFKSDSNIDQIIESIPNRLSFKKSNNEALVTVSSISEEGLQGLGEIQIEHLNLEDIFLEIYK